ncbi:MAG: hypothetical protein FWG98_00925 [Candidatus Cloacimonetes bacterium]|nr:hypothetical protein [Candidatus Cloacimonadota bacterium]
MGFFLTRFFWGGFLICWGLVLIIEKLFPIKIPFGRLIIAFLLIYGGVYLLTRTTKQKRVEVNTNIFTSSKVVNTKEGKEYNFVFGNNVIDLSDYDKSETIEINTVFGSSTVYLSRDKTYKIRANTAFGETKLPFQRESWLGSCDFIIGEKDRDFKIPIEINTVFGSTNVLLKNSEEAEEVTNEAYVDSEENNSVEDE